MIHSILKLIIKKYKRKLHKRTFKRNYHFFFLTAIRLPSGQWKNVSESNSFLGVIFGFIFIINSSVCMLHAQSLQSCPTLCDPMACSLPAPLSMGFSRQEYWSGLPLAFPGDLRNCSLQGSSVRGILQARILECFAMPSSRGSSRPMSLCPLHREAGFYH